ncbi:uncharacterized protein PITG_07767 [Phytophthora infestans T30-4]|uniref:Uncharacterized protein n=1 Tax=Phytophthora infestans (strain T30-4) TaxID=403677 RepID=D0N922_PHYIT|nr:uncharacterized protein PITG_07767 [Phytophthora infestans T30-4]EEY54057.1 conserved hypothetical protein [Phytophthora infestans T30-4]|eukprot:XP_002904688.1 conserved hypothetical protein [Phytophthora infestans T30-4]
MRKTQEVRQFVDGVVEDCLLRDVVALQRTTNIPWQAVLYAGRRRKLRAESPRKRSARLSVHEGGRVGKPGVTHPTKAPLGTLSMDVEQVRVSGFKRILVRLDEATRRKYCCRALEQDLQHVKSQMRSCTASMAEAKQVEDATRKLHASQRAAVSSELLDELEVLHRQLGASIDTLILGRKLQNGELDTTKEDLEVKEEVDTAETSTSQEAKTVARQILQTKEFETADEDEKKKKWWKKHVQKAATHTLELVRGDGTTVKRLSRLDKSLKKLQVKCPELKDWLTNMQKQFAESVSTAESVSATKTKKKRAIALPDDGETAIMSTAASSSKPKKTKSAENTKEKKTESAEKARALLHRCSREVRTLRDKFELGAYDVNLSRMVTVVDSLWSGFEHAELVALTTALFTLVETVEKVVNQAKRRDRLMCLESVLGVVLGSTKLQLTARRKTMVEEYANNCRQSLQQLDRQADSTGQPTKSPAQNGVPSTPRQTLNVNGSSHAMEDDCRKASTSYCDNQIGYHDGLWTLTCIMLS